VNKLFDDMCTVLVFRSMIVYARRYQRVHVARTSLGPGHEKRIPGAFTHS
jgi:hypothetical protein